MSKISKNEEKKEKKYFIFNKKTFNIIDKLDETEFSYFLKIIKKVTDNDEIVELKKYYATKHLNINTANNDSKKESNENKSWIFQFYKNEIVRINYALSNEDLRKKIKGIKIFIHGKTGTGKTTFVNKIINANQNYTFEKIDFTNIVSSKMGQTQINLMSLANNLNSSNKKIIIFLDELDSLVTNRANSNELGEHLRIVGTFIKFMDELNDNIVFIAATNLKDRIDEAIIRRFNMILESKTINLDQMDNLLKKETDFNITTNEINILKTNIIDNTFTFADTSNYISKYNLDKMLNLIKHDWAHFLLNFSNKFAEKLELTNKRQKELKMEKNYNE